MPNAAHKAINRLESRRLLEARDQISDLAAQNDALCRTIALLLNRLGGTADITDGEVEALGRAGFLSAERLDRATRWTAVNHDADVEAEVIDDA